MPWLSVELARQDLQTADSFLRHAVPEDCSKHLPGLRCHKFEKNTHLPQTSLPILLVFLFSEHFPVAMLVHNPSALHSLCGHRQSYSIAPRAFWRPVSYMRENAGTTRNLHSLEKNVAA
jgi:hypothetical protein